MRAHYLKIYLRFQIHCMCAFSITNTFLFFFPREWTNLLEWIKLSNTTFERESYRKNWTDSLEWMKLLSDFRARELKSCLIIADLLTVLHMPYIVIITTFSYCSNCEESHLYSKQRVRWVGHLAVIQSETLSTCQSFCV